MAFLLIERGKDAGVRIALKDFPVTLGRDPGNTIVISDAQASRFHLRIKQRGATFILEDLDSRNGTYLNGDKMLNSTLQNGDKILVGGTEFVFLASEPNIQISQDFLNFDMQLGDAQDQVAKSIQVDSASHDRRFKPVRLDPMSLLAQAPTDIHSIRNIYELHSDLISVDNLDEAAQILLKGVGKLIPTASRAGFFLWSAASRQLMPFSSRQFGKKKPMLISQQTLEGVVTRLQGVFLPAIKDTERQRLILPMFHNTEVLGVIHIEKDDVRASFSHEEMELAQLLMSRSAPIFESMILRKELDTWLIGMIETMIASVEAKDTYTRGHSERVSRYSMAIADELRLNKDVKKMLMVSALCHDIGKIGIPDTILKKASLLSAEEYAEMKLHPTIGADIINHMPNAKRIVSGVKYHHEKWDGTGYPEGLVGEEIPFFGRIVALADVFDAMVSGRAYSGFLDQPEAVSKLYEERELFDPEIVKAFMRAHDNGRLTLKTSTQNREPPTPDTRSTRFLIPELHDQEHSTGKTSLRHGKNKKK